jgi:hypothetical protein
MNYIGEKEFVVSCKDGEVSKPYLMEKNSIKYILKENLEFKEYDFIVVFSNYIRATEFYLKNKTLKKFLKNKKKKKN